MTVMRAHRSGDATAPSGARWSVVLPVKGGVAAKSRLSGVERADGGLSRTQLARAIVVDTLEAVLACPQVATVLVVTGDPAAARDAVRLGARHVGDPGRGLDAALRAGTAAAAADAPCALLLADLPALRPQDLGLALDLAARALHAGARQVFVPDAEGTGTVLLGAVVPADLDPHFGSGSAQAHACVARPLGGAPLRLRRDVDEPAHLEQARGLGLGPRTTALLAGSRDDGGSDPSAAGQARSTTAPSAASFSPNRS